MSDELAAAETDCRLLRKENEQLRDTLGMARAEYSGKPISELDEYDRLRLTANGFQAMDGVLRATIDRLRADLARKDVECAEALSRRERDRDRANADAVAARERATYWTQQFDTANGMVIELRLERDSAARERNEALSKIDALRADLARALPVVEAAGAVVADWSDSDLDDNSDHPLWNRLDALARAVRAAREPRTGEQG